LVASVSPTLPIGASRETLDATLARSGEGSISRAARYAALEQFASLPPPRAPQGRFWRYDYAKLNFPDLKPQPPAQTIAAPGRPGVTVVPFAQARAEHGVAFQQVFGRVLGLPNDRFAALALAFQNTGTFIHIAAGTIVDDPIVVTYDVSEGDAFPYTLISLGEGARATIVEEFSGASPGIVCGISEIVLDARASLHYASVQQSSAQSQVFFARRTRCGAASSLHVALAELGSALTYTTLHSALSQPEASVELTSLFFNTGDQHIDLTTDVDHLVGPTRSQTVVKSVATGRGQGRYLGNIAIRAGARGAEASLRDDALLLSKEAHIDSIPALEIASNDVKAFHGATVGSIDEEELFYVTSRGISRTEAERMIALGFFEPALERFPGESLRARLRSALESKLE
jgi:Fe-S cluster assembly protein SufD